MKHLDQDYHFVIKVHPLSKLEIKDKRIFTCEEFSSSEMLSVADYVISDYSCIIYEAAIMNKPIYLYDFDIDEYNDKRGLNIDLDEELPGCVSQDFKDIMNSIKDKEYDFELYEGDKEINMLKKQDMLQKILLILSYPLYKN